MSERTRLAAPLPPPAFEEVRPGKALFRALLGTSALALLLAAGPAAAQAATAKPVPRGPDASLTLLPVRLAGQPFDIEKSPPGPMTDTPTVSLVKLLVRVTTCGPLEVPTTT